MHNDFGERLTRSPGDIFTERQTDRQTHIHAHHSTPLLYRERSDGDIMNLSLRDHVKPALKQPHWFPVEQRITYKLCLFIHHTHTGQAPQ